MTAEVDEIVERARVVDVVNRLFLLTDNRDWPGVTACFAPEVHFDMSSAGGGAAGMKSAGDIVAMWETGLKPMHAIHHQAGNYAAVVSGRQATVFCYGTATHFLPNPSGRNTRTFVGSYDVALKKTAEHWSITRFAFHLKFIDGNVDLERSAEAPAPAKPAVATSVVEFLLQSGYKQIPVSMSAVGHLHAAGTLNGRAVSILLDTGGASTVVHLGLVKEMGLATEKLPFQGGGAGAAKMDVFNLPGAILQMRDVRPRVRLLAAMDLSHVNEALKMKGQPPVDVIIGADVFEAHAVVIDYGSRSIFLKA